MSQSSTTSGSTEVPVSLALHLQCCTILRRKFIDLFEGNCGNGSFVPDFQSDPL